jgi:ABC-type branched-subunit amino acid transport system substrate-binding protein
LAAQGALASASARWPNIGTALLAMFAAAAAAVAAEVTVAQVSAFSGKLATASRDYNLGLHACIADHNSRATPGEHRLRLVSRDDAFDPQLTAVQVDKLLRDEQPVAFVGLTGTRNVRAALDAGIGRDGVPVVGVRSASAELHRLPGLFHLRPAHTVEVERLLAQVASVGVQRVALVVSDDAYGAEAFDAAMAAVGPLKLSVVSTSRYAPRAVDLSAAAAGVHQASPQAVLLVADTQASADFVRRFRALNRSAFVVAVSDTEGDVLVSLLGPELARGLGVAQVTPDPRRGNRAVSRDFFALMQRLQVPDDRINHGSIGGYIACQVLLKAVARAGPKPTAASTVAALQSLGALDLGGFVVSFGPRQREGSRFVDLSVIDERGALRQ